MKATVDHLMLMLGLISRNISFVIVQNHQIILVGLMVHILKSKGHKISCEMLNSPYINSLFLDSFQILTEMYFVINFVRYFKICPLWDLTYGCIIKFCTL